MERERKQRGVEKGREREQMVARGRGGDNRGEQRGRERAAIIRRTDFIHFNEIH